ncbi:hypothetical protein SUGI_0728100 [Cryptomeria japonica]|uniref:transcription factor bHLH100 n=1 Tax=Cryptomeria japonica TaxID=3369 RepID=UPI00241489A0|nr:transcription factor bHLH100 [Cryptomeria japonica]GLJ36269.1 hypothetical protein SUGI_0728100 [Cryptomeria japonica]
MAVELYTQYFSSHPSDLSNTVATNDYNPHKRCSDLTVDELFGEANSEELIVLSEEDIKRRRRNQNIVLCERTRRKKMKHLFSTLQSLLPESTTPKVPRYCIIEETSKHIENLQNKVQALKKKKAQLLATHCSSTKKSLRYNHSSAIEKESIRPHVGIQVYSSETAIIRITASRMPLSLCKIYEEVESHGLDIQSADVYKGNSLVFLYFHATVIAGTDCHNSLEMSQGKPSLHQILQKIY